MLIQSSAPTRIDLAGGTMDIWPLYLFHPNARTINVAINRRVKVSIKRSEGTAISIRSEDLNEKLRLTSIDYLDEVDPNHPLILIVRLLGFFRPKGELGITTSSMIPSGTGLGGSSSLAIALCGAFNFLIGKKYSREELITIAKNLEAQILGVPTGVQDYFPAMYGGLNSILLNILDESPLRYSGTVTRTMESRIVLINSGQSRNSGINNWEAMKSYLDKNETVVNAFRGIQDTAINMEKAIKTSNYGEIAKYFEKDMKHRKQICPDMLTDKMKELIELGKENGAASAKVCGAGGGGCIAYWTNDSKSRSKLMSKLREKKVDIIDFHIDSQGLAVSSS